MCHSRAYSQELHGEGEVDYSSTHTVKWRPLTKHQVSRLNRLLNFQFSVWNTGIGCWRSLTQPPCIHTYIHACTLHCCGKLPSKTSYPCSRCSAAGATEIAMYGGRYKKIKSHDSHMIHHMIVMWCVEDLRWSAHFYRVCGTHKSRQAPPPATRERPSCPEMVN